MLDTYLSNYVPDQKEIRVFCAGRWSRLWTYSQSRSFAYHPWAVVGMLPFPVGWKDENNPPREAYENAIRQFRPHLLHLPTTYSGDAHISYEFIRELGSRSIKVIARHNETYLTHGMKHFTELPPLVNILYTLSPTHVRTLKEFTGCTNIRFLSTGADTTVYFPIDVEKQIDLLYLGHAAGASKSRNDLIFRVDQEFDDLWVGGSWWDKWGNLRHWFGGAFQLDFSEWNSRAKIGLCLIPDHHAVLEMYYACRLVNTMATRTFALTTYTPRLEELFTRKEHLDWYTTPDELIDLIHYWLKHDDEREQVARQGYQHVLKNFTARQRTRRILKDVGLIR